MHIPEEVIKDIGDKTDIEDINWRVCLIKRAGRYLKGLCPFHSEKTPSFTVTPDKGMYYCYGCHKGGNVFSFLMEIEKMTFPESVEYLAVKAGIDLSYLKSSGYSESDSIRKKLLDLYDKVSGSFSYILETSPICKCFT